MSLLSYDPWARDDPEGTARTLQGEAAKTAWHAYNALERAVGQVRSAMADPNLPAEWADQLRNVCREAGNLASLQEGC